MLAHGVLTAAWLFLSAASLVPKIQSISNVQAGNNSSLLPNSPTHSERRVTYTRQRIYARDISSQTPCADL
jgi:hypothetical protein